MSDFTQAVQYIALRWPNKDQKTEPGYSQRIEAVNKTAEHFGKSVAEVEDAIAMSKPLQFDNVLSPEIVAKAANPGRVTAPPPNLILHDAIDQIVLPQAPSYISKLIYHRSTASLLGKPKVGKTTFLLDGLYAVLSHVDFLKLSTMPTNVIYITEQYVPSFTVELGNSGLLGKRAHDEHLHFATIEDWYRMTWGQIIEQVGEWRDKLNAGIVAFDTLSRIARVENENDASEMQAAIDVATPLIKAGATLIFPQHERKSGGEIFDAGRGSNAITGAVEAVLRLKHPSVGKQPDTYRELEYLGRFPGAGNQSNSRPEDARLK